MRRERIAGAGKKGSAVFRDLPCRLFLLAAAVAALIPLCVGAGGCGGERSPAEWLDRAAAAAEEYASGDGYLHFREEMSSRLEVGSAFLEQRIVLEGECLFPLRERYRYRETLESSELPEGKENSFDYITLDGGKTAYVQGEALAAALGVVGWVHYTPPAGENRYFNYPDLIRSLTHEPREPEVVGHEEVGEVKCVHLRYRIDAEKLFRRRLEEEPTLREKYGEVGVEELLGELAVDLWVGEEDGLPRRVVVGEARLETEAGTASVGMTAEFTGYGEEAPVSIEEPAEFTEAV